MRLKSFVWFAVAVVVILLILVGVQAHGGGLMAGWLPNIHGH